MAKFRITISVRESQLAQVKKLVQKKVNISMNLQRAIDKLAAKHGIK